MKKTIWSLAALMLMAAPMMTSCSNDLDGVTPAEEVKSNIMTITIAPPEAEPETRVDMGGTDGLTVDGWEQNDEVTLYKITGEFHEMQVGDPKTFKCTNVTTGTFTCTDWSSSDDISDYKLAVFGATAENMNFQGQNAICIMPKNKFSGNLKDVVMMAATSTDGKYTMKIINNVVKIENFPTEDKDVAWYSNAGDDEHPFACFAPMVAYVPFDFFEGVPFVGVPFHQIPNDYKHERNDKTCFTIDGSSLDGVVYVNMCLSGSNEKWCLRGEHEHEIILNAKKIPANAIGKLYTATANSQDS